MKTFSSLRYIKQIGLVIFCFLPQLAFSQAFDSFPRRCEDLLTPVQMDLKWMSAKIKKINSLDLSEEQGAQASFVVRPGHSLRFSPEQEFFHMNHFLSDAKPDPVDGRYYHEIDLLASANNHLYLIEKTERKRENQFGVSLYRVKKSDLNLAIKDFSTGIAPEGDLAISFAIPDLPDFPTTEYKNQRYTHSIKYATDLYLAQKEKEQTEENPDANKLKMDPQTFEKQLGLSSKPSLEGSTNSPTDGNQKSDKVVKLFPKNKDKVQSHARVLLQELGIPHKAVQSPEIPWNLVKKHLLQQKPIVINTLVTLKKENQTMRDLKILNGEITEQLTALDSIFHPFYETITNEPVYFVSVVAVGFLPPPTAAVATSASDSGGYLIVMGANQTQPEAPALWPLNKLVMAFNKENSWFLLKELGLATDEQVKMKTQQSNMIIIGTKQTATKE